jgi:benzoyl-CoA reductase/2-hydroxyglutaryl-CoA dehydratase subunit BcrC/BadD/HgdB
VRLLHASLWLDKALMVKTLESVIEELEKPVPAPKSGPRVLLTGSTLAYGDGKILSLIEEHSDRNRWEKI